MVKSLTVINYVNQGLEINLSNPWKSGLAITSITGLGAPTANINTTDFPTGDGGVFNSARTETRNIVIEMKLLEAPTIEAARLLTYKYFPVKKPLTLVFETESRRVYCIGYVESNEQEHFSEWTKCQISIICPFPFFYSTEIQETMFYGVTPKFEFAVEPTNAIEFGDIYHNDTRVLSYLGDVETGVVIKMRAVGDVKNITIYNTSTYEIMKVNTDKLEAMTGKGFGKGDVITISTIKGQKTMILLRDGVEYNIVNCLGKNTAWFTLQKGDNIFAFSAEVGSNELTFSIESRIVYEGI